MSHVINGASQTIELETSSTASLDWSASWNDQPWAVGNAQGNVASATDTVIVAAAGASIWRAVKTLSFVNRSTTASNTIKVMRDVSGTEYVIFQAILTPGDVASYTDNEGWNVRNSAGSLKVLPVDRTGIAAKSYKFQKTGAAAEASGAFHSTWLAAGFPGAWAPGTPGLNGRNTDGTDNIGDGGCISVANPASGANYLTGLVMTSGRADLNSIYDVVWVNSGLVVTTTTAQAITTATFPARDLNGATLGAGYFIGILVTGATGNGGAITNMTVEYTNSAGTGSRTATMASFAATAVAGYIGIFDLAAGDYGVRSIQGITLGTSLVSGTVSLFVARQIADVSVVVAGMPSTTPFPADPGLRLYNGVCLLHVYLADSVSAHNFQGSIYVVER